MKYLFPIVRCLHLHDHVYHKEDRSCLNTNICNFRYGPYYVFDYGNFSKKDFRFLPGEFYENYLIDRCVNVAMVRDSEIFEGSKKTNFKVSSGITFNNKFVDASVGVLPIIKSEKLEPTFDKNNKLFFEFKFQFYDLNKEMENDNLPANYTNYHFNITLLSATFNNKITAKIMLGPSTGYQFMSDRIFLSFDRFVFNAELECPWELTSNPNVIYQIILNLSQTSNKITLEFNKIEGKFKKTTTISKNFVNFTEDLDLQKIEQ